MSKIRLTLLMDSPLCLSSENQICQHQMELNIREETINHDLARTVSYSNVILFVKLDALQVCIQNCKFM